MPLSTAAKNAMLDNEGTRAVFASLHSAYPGDTGASEITGGTPPYTRQPINWNTAASGNLDNNLNPTFNVPAATTIAWLGLWTLVTGGTYQGCVPLGGAASKPFETSSSTDTFTAEAHGYTDTQKVVVYATSNVSLPGGLTEGTIYFVRDSATNTFKLTATSGGTAIDITTDGAGFIQTVVPETFGGQGTYVVSDVDIALNR